MSGTGFQIQLEQQDLDIIRSSSSVMLNVSLVGNKPSFRVVILENMDRFNKVERGVAKMSAVIAYSDFDRGMGMGKKVVFHDGVIRAEFRVEIIALPDFRSIDPFSEGPSRELD